MEIILKEQIIEFLVNGIKMTIILDISKAQQQIPVKFIIDSPNQKFTFESLKLNENNISIR